MIIVILVFLFIYIEIKRKRQLIETRCKNLDSLLKREQKNFEEEILQKEAEINKIKEQLSELKLKDEQKRLELEKALNVHRHELENICYDSKQNKLCDSCFKRTKIYGYLIETS